MSKMIAYIRVKTALDNALTNIPRCKSFKVGKTTQTLEERFSQNYEDTYKDIKLLYNGGTDGKLVDELEVELINYCKNKYSDQCDNEQQGGGPTCEENADEEHTAKLYLVWK